MADVINTKECLNCGKDLVNLPKKRKKVFCNDTCRSNYWQKSDRLEKQGKSIEEIVSILEKQRKEKKGETKVVDLTHPKEKTNYTINTSIAQQIAKHEAELLTLQKGMWADTRRNFLNREIAKLKKISNG
jgi:DNA-binding transcriptional MerR regulator